MNSHPCKFQLHIRPNLSVSGKAGGVNKPDQSGTRPYIRRASTQAKEIERCRREVESCRNAGANLNLTPAEKRGHMANEAKPHAIELNFFDRRGIP